MPSDIKPLDIKPLDIKPLDFKIPDKKKEEVIGAGGPPTAIIPPKKTDTTDGALNIGNKSALALENSEGKQKSQQLAASGLLNETKQTITSLLGGLITADKEKSAEVPKGAATPIEAPKEKPLISKESDIFKPVVKQSGGVEKQDEQLQKEKIPQGGDAIAAALALKQQQTESKKPESVQ